MRCQQHDLEDMGYCDQHLTSDGVIYTIVTRMNCPYRLPRRFIALRESGHYLRSNLIHEGFGRCNVDQNSVFAVFKDLFHCVERDKCFAGTGRSHHKEALPGINQIQNLGLPPIRFKGSKSGTRGSACEPMLRSK